MSVAAGDSVLHYRLVEKIGEGGMGVVWKALDTTLDREVAIKFLPTAFAEDPGRLERFDREARLLASLHHPNIASVFGLHEERSVRFIAMELVPGEELRERIARGPLPIEDALEVARQIAEGLEAAHDQGVIHRDLKPANVKITPDGKVKVLDLGLAKALLADPNASSSSGDPAHSPTLTSAGTQAGMIIGTAAYMSPEQARGQAVDRRADIWAIGCILYEMLTGRQPFGGETVSDTLAAVLRAEVDFDALPAGTPVEIRRLLRRCLDRDPRRRLRDAGELRVAAEYWTSQGGTMPAGPAHDDVSPARPVANSRLPWAVAAILAVVTIISLGVAFLDTDPEPDPTLDVAITLPQALILMAAGTGEPLVTLSPDGRRIAFTARRDDMVRLYLRALDSFAVVEIPETEGASGPFFSPDGEWIAFFRRGRLSKVSVRGGTPVELADAPSPRGGAWGPDDSILFSPAYNSGLFRVPAAGGEPEELSKPNNAQNERTYRWPHLLPGGKAVLFTIGTQDQPGYYEDATIAVLDLESGRIRPLIEGGSFARYAAPGHIVYSREGELLAVPIDLDRLELSGPPTSLMTGVARAPTSGAVHFSISDSGTLLYIPASEHVRESELTWVDRTGRVETAFEIPPPYLTPRLSPDGSKAALTIGPGPGDGDVWIYDFSREIPTRLTFDSFNVAPLWSPDGHRVIYGSTRGGHEGLAWKAADGSDVEVLVARDRGESAALPDAWLPGSDTIVYSRFGGRGGSDIMYVSLDDPEPRPLLDGPDGEGGATFSPDGRWMAYCSDESGQYEVYVRPYPGPGGKWQVSSEGGKGPVWSRDGGEIYYTHGRKMMAAGVETMPTFSPGQPRELFETDFVRHVGPWPDFDVTADGRRFLVVRGQRDDLDGRHIRLLTNLMRRLEP